MKRYIIKTAYVTTYDRGPRRSLQEELDDCPDGYTLHSVVPVAEGGGYTSYYRIIFEHSHVSPIPS